MTLRGIQGRRRVRLAAVALSLVVSACAESAPSPSEEIGHPAAGYALACWDVEPATCLDVAEGAVARLPVDAAGAAAVRVAAGQLVVALLDGAGSFGVSWSREPGASVTFGAWEPAPAARVAPASGPDPGQVIAFTLGHCGVHSPIDVDGALWDPHGPVPAHASELIDPTSGAFRRTGASTAVFVAPSGARVGLRRHIGAGSYLLCD